ncbi:DNA mismatch repair protein MutS [Peptoniphilus sp. KCTC 25270]|uniref:DNA mismatch repair protein MutS n=1 Tax=Peptoniphilus sp. KCTC 25270 TaxID=2897414 RepID=UPI001E43CE36|nr:DNA mismatch repair protein MutS [Peptoniphilus sp. KCTC 25270]MCD1147013.1 DNA mismatch repair protein MutS [Peptoniphilus sp. KCTC 25270]
MISKSDFSRLTPAMRHYVETKNKNPDAFLFYRMGDFYELFFDDAIEVSRLLDLTLTKKSGGLEEKIPMCGVPFRVAQQYVGRLVNKGYKVAICDQVEDPKEAKGLVKREITQIVTPGTFSDTDFISSTEMRYIMAIASENQTLSIAYCDYLSGEFRFLENLFFSEEDRNRIIQETIQRIRPVELLVMEKDPLYSIVENICKQQKFFMLNPIEEENIYSNTSSKISNLSSSIEEWGKENQVQSILPCKMILHYLSQTQMRSLEHLGHITLDTMNESMILSENTRLNLELTKNIAEFTKADTLFELLDETQTSMGSRRLKKWIEKPLLSMERIQNRQDFISALQEERMIQDTLKTELKSIYDFDRLAIKISQLSLTPKDLEQLKRSFYSIEQLKRELELSENPVLIEYGQKIQSTEDLYGYISKRIMEDPPINYVDQRYILEGFDEELDSLFEKSEGGVQWLLDLEKSEQERTGIKNLKIKYNKILGYFFEITKSNLDMTPEDYIRKQTLVGSERFYSVALKEQESQILHSKEQALHRQKEILESIREKIFSHLYEIQNLAEKISEVDALLGLSLVADEYGYVKPIFNMDRKISIKDGRHPMVEKNHRSAYVPNDAELSDGTRIQIITGPNMAGKSTYMRQLALIVIMAQMGSFVPASYCDLPIIDRVFTRIGASDNLAKGQSTFMVEMMEVSEILKDTTSDSLILLDEVGRGTSTNDGLSIAWATVEFLCQKTKSKVLFATHYHQLTELSEKYEMVENLTIATEEVDGEIQFLRKMIPGESNHSFGIEVAKLAGVNHWVIERANQVLKKIEKEDSFGKIGDVQLDFDSISVQNSSKNPEIEKFLEDISKLNVNRMTPIEAIQILNELQLKAERIDG